VAASAFSAKPRGSKAKAEAANSVDTFETSFIFCGKYSKSDDFRRDLFESIVTITVSWPSMPNYFATDAKLIHTWTKSLLHHEHDSFQPLREGSIIERNQIDQHSGASRGAFTNFLDYTKSFFAVAEKYIIVA
jgi:hypothetical protein